MRNCTNCRKQYEKEEKCNKCGKILGTEFICAKIETKSAHFCSKKCANTILAAASYPRDASVARDSPEGYECKACGYRSFPEDLETEPKLCPACASPNLTKLRGR